jgi:predicted Rossmann fold nucleotide-binding protein DprA/Smf involved in DNA uptake
MAKPDAPSDDGPAIGEIASTKASESREPSGVCPTSPERVDALDPETPDRHTAEESVERDQDGTESVLAAIGWERCSIEQILRRTGRPLSEVSVEIERLAGRGTIHGDGSWWERA